jgi:hypothetical protein
MSNRTIIVTTLLAAVALAAWIAAVIMLLPRLAP